MGRRTYGQRCAIAQSLDLLGERWTLLIVRELLIGPARFTDLVSGLPGIGPNLLADRLRLLRDEGLVAIETLRPPGVARVYTLTDKGRALEPVLLGLAAWGWEHLDPMPAAEHANPAWTVLALRGLFDAAAAADVDEAYEFHIDGTVFFAHVCRGRLETGLGTAGDPAVVITTDNEGLFALAAPDGGREAIATGRVRIEGTEGAWARCERVFGGARPEADD